MLNLNNEVPENNLSKNYLSTKTMVKKVASASLLSLAVSTPHALAEVNLYQQLVADPFAPTDVTLENYDDNVNAHLFEETACVTLTADLTLDVARANPGIYASPQDLNGQGAVIPAGSQVACAMIHSESDVVSGSITYKGIAEFGRSIAGLIVTTQGLDNSDSLCGSPLTTYPIAQARGLELDPVNQDMFEFAQVPRDSVRFQHTTYGKIDQIRIVMECIDQPQIVGQP